MTVRRPSIALLLAAGTSACMPGATVKPPHATIHSELMPMEASYVAPTDDGPLRVVFASPQNQTAEAAEITVVFSQPLRSVGDTSTNLESPLVMTPLIPGKTTWVGTTALRFVPDKPFAKATTIRVEIPKGTKAASGKILEEAFHFSFTTETPSITGSEPEANTTSVLPDSPITLYVNQPISASEISRAVTIVVNKKSIPFAITEIEKDHVVLTPRGPLPHDSEVNVHIDASLRGSEGNLAMGEPKDIRFRTLGPFALTSATCTPHPTEKDACDPNESQVKLTVTTLLPSDLWEQAIFVEPTTDSFAVYETGGEENGPAELLLSGSFEPGKTYSLGVRTSIAGKPLRDVHGQLVGQQNVRKLRFGNLPAEVTIGASGIYWAPGKHILPIGVLNMPEAAISMLPIRRDEVLERLMGHFKPLAALGTAKQRAVSGGKTNESNWERISVDELLPTVTTKGPVLARASFRAPGASEPSVIEREMQLTDIGLVTKTSPEDAVVWVTRLSDGAAMSGARVDLYELPAGGRPTLLSSAKADAGGIASVPIQFGPKRSDELAIVVEQGDDWAYQKVKTPALSEPIGRIFTGRGIYRPGETVEIKGIVRFPVTSGLVTPKDGEVLVRITNGHEGEIARARRTFSRFGTFSAELPIPIDAPLGYYQVDVQMTRGRMRSYFSVDQYRPIESKAFATVDKPAYFAGERMICTARGEHLYGAPLAGATAKIVMNRGSASLTIPGLDHFSVGLEDVYPPSARINQASGQLDANGTFALSASTLLSGQITTEMISCQVEIMDLDKTVQMAEESAIIHPADVYVALAHPEELWIHPGTTIGPKALVVTPAGERRAAPVHIEMVYHTRKDDRSFDDRVLASCDVTTGQTPMGCSFQTPKQDPTAEDQIIIRAQTKDSQGRTAISAYVHRIESLPTPQPVASTPAAPLPPPPQPQPPPPEDPPQLRIEMEAALHVGQTAHVTLTSPFTKPAKAMVTFEREGMIDRRTVELAPMGKKTTLDVPVTAAMMPQVHATVTAISADEVKTADFNVGVESTSRQLHVDVLPGKTKAAPGESLDVEVAVTNAEGKPANGVEVTLWAADEGSLMLTYYRTPDPWYAMFSDRYFLVHTDNARDELLTTWMGRHRTKPPSVRMGATSTSPRRGDFRQTVAFFPDLVTAANGRVKRRITLPDGLTAYRFMAVAVAEDDRTGTGESMVQTSKPFMARPTLPLVIRAGDEFEASVVVSTIDRPSGKATVEAHAQGLSAVGDGKKVVDLTEDGPIEVKFPFRADRVGKMSFSVDASFSWGKRSDTDAVDLQQEVASPTELEKVIVSGQTNAALAERIAKLPGIRSDAGGLSVSMTSSPLTGMVTGIEQLVEYPYGCTEQTVSRLVPLLALRDMADALQVPLVGQNSRTVRKTIPEALQGAVDSLLANQQGSGGFGLWPSSQQVEPWVTAYALWGLAEADRRGVVVPHEALERAIRALEPTFDKLGTESGPLMLERAAFGLDVLASMGRKNETKMKALWAERARLSTESRALLLHAYAMALPEARAEMADMVLDLSNAVKLAATSAFVDGSKSHNEFSSNVVATAMVLRAMLAFDAKYPVAPALAAYLLQSRNGGKYNTTHDAAWALLALDAYRQTLPAAKHVFDARVFLGNALLGQVHFGGDTLRGQTLHVPMQDVMKAAGGPLTFEVLGHGLLHYDVTLAFARDSVPNRAVDAGFFVSKSWRRVSEFGETASAVEVAEPKFVAGEVVVCEIEVVTPARRSFVVLEDPLPGGLEPIAMNYREGGAWLAKFESSRADRREKRDDRMVYFIDALPAGISRFRYLTRAKHTGKFLAPPTRVEQMYEPTIFGHTAARYVRVGSVAKP